MTKSELLREKWVSYKHHPFSFLGLILIHLAALFSVGIVIFLLAYILIMGIPNLSPELFAWHYDADNVSMTPAIINTIYMTLLTLAMAIPIGVGSAIYLTEYAKRGSKLVTVIRVTNETLAGIPSIVYGLFGFLAFVITCGFGYSMIAGCFTLAIMVLPTIMRTSEEAILAVPDSYREGSFGLGAGRVRTIARIILPTALPGILAGVILAIGRIVGETAALIFTSGTGTEAATSLTQPTRTLAVHMYCLLSEGLYTDQAYATAVVLIVMVIGINALSKYLAGKVTAADQKKKSKRRKKAAVSKDEE